MSNGSVPPPDSLFHERLMALRKTYLLAFRNSMLFGKCAGTLTELPLLHRATLSLEKKSSDEEYNSDEGYNPDIEIIRLEKSMSYALELLMKKEPEKHARGHRTFFAKKGRTDRSRAGQVLPNWLNRFKDDEFRESSRNLLHFTHKKKILNQQLDELTGSMHELEHQLNFLLQTTDYPLDEWAKLVSKRDAVARKEISIHAQIKALTYALNNITKMCDYDKIKTQFYSLYFEIYGRRYVDNERLETYDQVIGHMETSTQEHSTHLLKIFGDPGQGKSTLLQQLAYDYATNQLSGNNDHTPFFFKAKHIARLRVSKLETDHGLQELENEAYFDGFKTSELVDVLYDSNPDLKKYIGSEELSQLIELEGKDANAHPRCLLIDALDECSSLKDREYVRDFIVNEVEDYHSNLIVTCRTTHRESLVTDLVNEHSCLLKYSQEELRFDMPKKLSDAWGINREMLTISTNLLFEKYQNVLSHPLFVGWFCFLLRNNKVPITEQVSVEIKQENSVLNELHILFLREVIETGIDISIKEKYPNASERFDRKKIFDFFCLIAANYFTMNSQNLEIILTRIKRLHKLELDSHEQEFVSSNMGLLFVNDERTLEFTHETLPEVALGIILEDQRYAEKYLPSSVETSGLMHRRELINSSAWSECIVLTRALERGKMNGKSIKENIIDLLPSLPGPFIEKTISMLTSNQGPIVSLQANGLEIILEHETVRPSSDEITLYEIGQKYIESIENNQRFPLEFPNRFRNNTETNHPLDVLYMQTKIFDLSDLVVVDDSLKMMQQLSLSSAERLLELWTDEGDSQNPLLLLWYLGHTRHGNFDRNFETELIERITWDGQRNVQATTLEEKVVRLTWGLEYALSVHAENQMPTSPGGLEPAITEMKALEHEPFLHHLMAPIQSNQDLNLAYLCQQHGEELGAMLVEDADLLSETIADLMIVNRPVRDDAQMNKQFARKRVAALLSYRPIQDAIVQYFATCIWEHCKLAKHVGTAKSVPISSQLKEFWSLFDEQVEYEQGHLVLAPHPIHIIYSNSASTPKILLALLDLLLPYVGTDPKRNASQKERMSNFKDFIKKFDFGQTSTKKKFKNVFEYKSEQFRKD